MSPKKTLEGHLQPGVIVEGSAGTRPAEVRLLASGIVESTGGAANCARRPQAVRPKLATSSWWLRYGRRRPGLRADDRVVGRP